jgi:hypothetical protein
MSELTYLSFARKSDRAVLASCFRDQNLSSRERSDVENAVFDTLHTDHSKNYA